MKSTSNCLRQFPLAAKAASRRSTKFHAEKCLKTRHFSSGFESQQSCDMEVSMREMREGRLGDNGKRIMAFWAILLFAVIVRCIGF